MPASPNWDDDTHFCSRQPEALNECINAHQSRCRIYQRNVNQKNTYWRTWRAWLKIYYTDRGKRLRRTRNKSGKRTNSKQVDLSLVAPRPQVRNPPPTPAVSKILSRPNQRKGVNCKCYASLDTKGLMKVPTIPFDTADGNFQINLVNSTAFWIPGWHKPLMRHVLNSVSHHYLAQVTRTKQMVRDSFARAEADERSGKPERQVLEGILRALCLGLNPSSPNQALQQLQTFEVPEKISFANFLSELRIAVINVKSLALVPPNDSTVQVVVKASIDDQFATLAASVLAGRTRSAIPSSIIEGLLDSLGDLTLTRTPAIVATRFSKDIRGRD